MTQETVAKRLSFLSFPRSEKTNISPTLDKSIRMLCERTTSPLLKNLYQHHRYQKNMAIIIEHLKGLDHLSEPELSRYLGAQQKEDKILSNKRLVALILEAYHQDVYAPPKMRMGS